MTPDTALRLALYFGPSAEFWMSLQNAWDLHQARRQFRASIDDKGSRAR